MGRRTKTCLVAFGVVVAGAGCATDQTIWTHHTRASFVDPGPRQDAGDLIAGVLPLGSVPYDNRSLPRVSPDGRFVATQVGGPPAWETLLASPDRPLPERSRIEIYYLDHDSGEAQLQWVTPRGVLLGRGGDKRGFLVEQPLADGARWIGMMPWTGGRTKWLVDDDSVNAFASPGPDGHLAWSRRVGGAEHFDLVIRRGSEQWTVDGNGGDWLMPVWASARDLFVLRLIDGRLSAAYMDASSQATTRDTLQQVALAEQRTRYDAYQCLASYTPPGGLDRDRVAPMLTMWHPTAARMAVWLPLSSPAAPMLLDPRSIAAVVDVSGNVLVTTADGVRLQNPADPRRSRTLLPGTQVLRTVDSDAWPYMALSPRGDRISLMAVRLLRE
ncbi:MAG: hypothetical protein V3S08_01875 [Phycisphaerales bacterium]